MIKGRGATASPHSRYLARSIVQVDDGWMQSPLWEPEFLESLPQTKFYPDKTQTLISTNQSPDIPFEQSINAYKGCEHGCVYCFARPTHAYLDLSPGLDFETKIFYKTNVIDRLREALEKPNYICKPIAMGTNTDPYQPIERERQITRRILETLYDYKHPVSIVTKGTLILRDIELLQSLAQEGLLSVSISVTTLSNELKTKMEPRCASPTARLRVIRTLSEARIPVGVMVAPVIPMLNDHEIENIVVQSVEAGATHAGYVMIRLPLEVAPLFKAWLENHYALKAKRVMNRIKDLHGGKSYESTWGRRMRGSGVYADMIARRFEIVKRKVGFRQSGSRIRDNASQRKEQDSSILSHLDSLDETHQASNLRTDLFRLPDEQLPLFRS